MTSHINFCNQWLCNKS